MSSPDPCAARPPAAPSGCNSPGAPSTAQALSSDAGAMTAPCEPSAEGRAVGDAAHIAALLRGGSGAVVQWHCGSRDVCLTPADAVPGAGWVPAARLCATGKADTMQVTLLRPELRAYVDGQRLLRLESPVRVRACQRLRFGADHRACVAKPCGSPLRLTNAASPPPLATPEPAQADCLGATTPAPAAAPTPVPFTPLSSHLSSCADVPLKVELLDAAPGTATATGTPSSPAAAASLGRPSRRHPQSVAAPPTNAVRDMALTRPPDAASGSTDVRPTGEKCTVSAALTDRTSSDLAVEASAAGMRCTADVVDTAAAGGELADAMTRAVPTPPPPPGTSTAGSSSAWSPSASARDATAVLERRRDEVLRDIFGNDGPPPPPPPRRTPQPHWTLGTVVDVCSPDWSALAVADVGVEVGRPSGLYQSVCDSTTFGSALAVLRHQHTVNAASAVRSGQPRHSARPLEARGARPGPGCAAQAPPSSCGFSLHFSDRTSIAAGHCGAASVGRRSATSWDGGGGASAEPVSAAGCGRAGRALTYVALVAAAAADQERRRLRAKLRLLPRVTVDPHVVEAFGASHRYRPLARVVEPEPAATASPGAAFSVGASPRGPLVGRGSAAGEAGGRTSLLEKSAAGPWQYPPAADELVSPRTEALMRGALRLGGEAGGAVADAAFVHCVLRRSYDVATDRFAYIGSPEVTELLRTRFSSVLAALTARLRTGRPVLRVSSPVVCGGDLLGSFADALKLLGSAAFFDHWSALHTPVLLLGNYVDVGWHSVEVCMLLCSWACLQPSMVHLLRGPHEDPTVNGCYRLLGKRCLRYKCRQRFGSARGVELWSQLNAVFAQLPVAAIVDKSIFAAHGGVPLLRSAPHGGGEGSACGPRQRRGVYSGTSESATPTASASASPSAHSASWRAPPGAAAGGRWLGMSDGDWDAAGLLRAVRRGTWADDAAGGTERVYTAATVSAPARSHGQESAECDSEALTEASPAIAPKPSHPAPTRGAAKGASQSAELAPTASRARDGADAGTTTTESRQAALSAVPRGARLPLVSESRDVGRRRSPSSSVVPRSVASPAHAEPSKTARGCGGSASNRSAFAGSGAGELDEVAWASISASNSEMLDEEVWRGMADLTPSEADFATLLAATTMQAHAFASLVTPDKDYRSVDEARVRQRQQRLVREVVWNRPRDAAAALLPVDERARETIESGGDLFDVPWWRPRAVACCTGDKCRGARAHGCCHVFGASALLRFLCRFGFALLLRGAPDDTEDFCGAALCEEGRLLSLSSCARQGRRVRQAAACVVGRATTVRLATWGSQELADSLGQLSLSSLPGVREAEQERADFEQFVCDTMQARHREHRLVGLDNQWSVASAYEAFCHGRGVASRECGAAGRPPQRHRR